MSSGSRVFYWTFPVPTISSVLVLELPAFGIETPVLRFSFSVLF